MESREKCDEIVQQFNGKCPNGCAEPLLVKFADSGKKLKTKQQNSIGGMNFDKIGDSLAAGYSGLAYDPIQSSMMANGLSSSLIPNYAAAAAAAASRNAAFTQGMMPAAATYFIPSTPYLMPQTVKISDFFG
jgi:hypothetical protein